MSKTNVYRYHDNLWFIRSISHSKEIFVGYLGSRCTILLLSDIIILIKLLSDIFTSFICGHVFEDIPPKIVYQKDFYIGNIVEPSKLKTFKYQKSRKNTYL